MVEGQWNVPWLELMKPRDILKWVVAYSSPSWKAREDYISWKWITRGKFSFSESYKNLCSGSESTSMASDDLVWRIKAAQRVRKFLWILAHDHLLTNENRPQRGMSQFPFFDRCGMDVESCLHAVSDCAGPKAIWKIVVPRSEWHHFFHLLIEDWLIWNISNEGNLGSDYGEWPTFFYYCLAYLERLQ